MNVACPHCGAAIDLTGFTGGDFLCSHCQGRISGSIFAPQPIPRPIRSLRTDPVTKRYPNLRRIARLYRAAAFLDVALGVLLIAAVTVGGMLDPKTGEFGGAFSTVLAVIIVNLVILAAAFWLYLIHMAIAELITLGIDIEENTRSARQSLRNVS